MVTDLETILINLAYDKLDEPNLSNLNFEPEWLLNLKSDNKQYVKWSQVHNYLPNLLNTFNKNTLDYFYNSNSNFIYPILIYTNDLFYNHDTLEFNSKLIKCVKQKRAKIVFFYITEGDWGTNPIHFDWIENLVSKYELNKEDLLFVTANLKAVENYKGNKFTIIPYNFFLINLDFIPLNKSNKNDIKLYESNYLKYIEDNKKNKKIKHILCFNGIARLNRLLVFAQLNLSHHLKGKYITSLKKSETQNSNDFYNQIVGKTNNKNIVDFYKKYDSLQSVVYDKSLWGNIISWGATLNEDAHMSTFVNIITETLWNTESIFFTEKTYKPIYMCQPFILFGNPYSLKKLKEYGFKTFDKWWDESYDEELDLDIRLEKITKVLEEIANWDFDKCYEITNQMKEVFIHNFNNVLSVNELINLYTTLQTDTKPIEKSKLL
jgi:hypothetical protein